MNPPNCVVQLPPPTDLWPLPVSARDLHENPPVTPNILIDGVLHQGGTSILAGQSKAKKTWTLLDQALAVATGLPWMGLATKAVPVLYINFELPSFLVEKRLGMIAQHRGVSLPANLHMWNLRAQVIDLDLLRERLPEQIKRLGVGLVIIDPLYKLSACSGVQENSNDDFGRFLTELEAMTSGQGVALSIAHHFAKGDAAAKNALDRASGGGALARWPDLFCSLTPHQTEGCMTVEFAVRAFAPVAPYVVRWEFPAWVREDSLDPSKLRRAAGKPEQHSAAEVLAKLKDGSNNKEWMAACGLAETTFRNKRNQLMAEGKVRCSDECFYRT